MMIRSIFFVLAMIMGIFLGRMKAGEYPKLDLIEPISKSTITIPEGEIIDSTLNEFKKYEVLTSSSLIRIYSMKNTNNMSYSWKQINDFDRNHKYGTPISKEKLGGKKEGWIRWYADKNKLGNDIVNCVSVIRGNGYALYILETALDSVGLVSPDIVRTTDFKQITGRRINNDGKFTWRMWCILVVIGVLSVVLRAYKHDVPMAIYVMIAVVGLGGLFCGMYFYGLFSWQISAYTTLMTSIVVGGILFIPSSAVGHVLGEILDNIDEFLN